MAAASAVLEVLVGPAKGRHEFKRVPDPYDPSMYRFTVDCYDVGFDHQGRCELRCEGDDLVLTEDQYVLWLPRATID